MVGYLCTVKVLAGRSGNASEYVYLFLKGWPHEGWSQYLASLSTTILYMQYPLPRFEHLAALRQAWQLLKQNKSLYRYPLIISLLTLGCWGICSSLDTLHPLLWLPIFRWSLGR